MKSRLDHPPADEALSKAKTGKRGESGDKDRTEDAASGESEEREAKEEAGESAELAMEPFDEINALEFGKSHG
jgi:hypothetical protein